MNSMMLALTGVQLYSPNSFPLLQMTPLILPAAEKTFKVMLLPLVLLANIWFFFVDNGTPSVTEDYLPWLCN